MSTSSPVTTVALTIFPLGTVLLPGGVLPLRIFETRYNDMVRECLRNDEPFGVCLITSGNEAGVAADHELVGCTAKIVDFDQEQPGILRIRAVGQQAFKVHSKSIDKQGLTRAQVIYGDAENQIPMPSEYGLCRQVLEQVMGGIAEQTDAPEDDLFQKPYQFNSANWVSHRLSEVLPLSSESKQLMLELANPLDRLKLLNQVLLKQSGKQTH